MQRLLVLLILLLPTAVRAENWPSWRGPTGDGLSSAKDLPVTWSSTKNVRWKVPLQGAGVSQPIVWDDHIVLTASTGRWNDRLHVYCYSRQDGKLRWHTPLLGTAPTDLYPAGGMAVPTPVTDGKHVYALFGTGDLACLDFDGRPLWIRSLAEEYGPFRNRWGMGTSPILVNGMVVVQVDHWSQSYLLAVDALTGKNRWKTARSESVNWTTPLAVKVKDHVEIVVLGTERARAYDARNGIELWQVKGLHFQCIPTAVTLADTVVATSGVGSTAIRLDGRTGDLTASHTVWTNKKANAFVPSPIIYDGLLYIPGDKGIVTCYDAKTGAQVWKERLGGSYHASPVAGAGKVYLTDMEGVVHVVQAGREYKLLADNAMGERIVASPALAHGDVILRGEKHLYCVSAPK